MIKISIEINGDIFSFDYNCGKERQHGESDITTDTYALISEVMRTLAAISKRDNDKMFEECRAMAWIEKHPEEAKKFMERKAT